MDDSGQEILADETYHETYEKFYLYSSTNDKICTKVKKARWTSITNFFMVAFLPHGFPDTVSKDYLQYQIWDSVQAFASSIVGGIATHAVLKGAGVGNENATPLAATITWLVKDGTSMVGRIVFAWFQGTKLDSDCKKWRLFADILNDAALFLDMFSAYFQEYFMPIICLSGLFKAIVGVAGGATRAALTQHQARQNNMADVSAKDGSQETLVNLAALICSLLIIPTVIESIMLTWLVYILMTATHLLANYFAVTSVVMETFNKSRFRIYIDYHLQKNMSMYLSVEEVNVKENVWPVLWEEPVKIVLGSSFGSAIDGKSYKEIQGLIDLYEDSDYFLSIKSMQKNKATIFICFTKNATSVTQLEAMHQACLLENMIRHPKGTESNANSMNLMSLYSAECHFTDDEKYSLEKFSKRLTEKYFGTFKSHLMQQGWNTSTVMFDADSWKVCWKRQKKVL